MKLRKKIEDTKQVDIQQVELKREFKRRIAVSKNESCNDIIKDLDRDIWGKAYQIFRTE